MDSPLKHFADLRDPRVEQTREHLLEEILLITIAAVLSGCNGWNEIEDYAHSKHAWFKGFLTLPSGIPSHDTFNRVFSALDPEELEKGFVAWVSSIAKLTAGYILAVKENQGHLLEEIKDSFEMLSSDAVAEEIDYGHGRVEQRRCSVIADLSLIEKAREWASLRGLVRIEAKRYHKATGGTETEIRYYITSLEADAARQNQCIRQHWGIENKLHWVLDVGFGEDLGRKRAGFAAQNFSVLNRIALNLLKQDKTSKRGVHGKRLMAGWDNDSTHPRSLCNSLE
jgi:predicted transposase YbfD/YdcC